jgi:hypothetical protein
VPGVAATILWANVHDQRLRVFGLSLQGGDERILAVHYNVVHLPFVFEPDGEVHRDDPTVEVGLAKLPAPGRYPTHMRRETTCKR